MCRFQLTPVDHLRVKTGSSLVHSTPSSLSRPTTCAHCPGLGQEKVQCHFAGASLMVSERSVSSPPCSPPTWVAEWRPPLWLWSCLLPSLCWASSHGSPLTHILQRQTPPRGQCPDWSSPQCPPPPHYPLEALPAFASAVSSCHPETAAFQNKPDSLRPLGLYSSLYSYMAFPPPDQLWPILPNSKQGFLLQEALLDFAAGWGK